MALVATGLGGGSSGSGGVLVTASPAELAALEREGRAFNASMQRTVGVEQAMQRVNSDQFTIPVFVVGHSKIGTEHFPMMIYTVMPDFRRFAGILNTMPELNEKTGAIEVVVDARSKDQREREVKQNIDLLKQPVYDEDDVRGKQDPKGNFRRVRVRFAPGSIITFRNKEAQCTSLKRCTFAIINVQAGAWHEENGTVAVSPKLVSVVDTLAAPTDEAYMNWMYTSGMWTKAYFTKVGYYRKQMALLLAEKKKGAEKPAAEKTADGAAAVAAEAAPEIDNASIRYRNDNQMIIAMGYQDHLTEQLRNPEGCHLVDITDITKESNLVDTRKGLTRYLAMLQGRQWTTNAQGQRVETSFTISTPLYAEVTNRFGITSLTNWKTMLPTLRNHMKALIVVCEDAERTWQSALVQQRLAQAGDDPEAINKAPANEIAFALSVTQRDVIIDAVSTITSISIPVSAQTVREYFWNGESAPPKIPEDAHPVTGGDPRLINLSELRDQRREFDNADYSLHLLTNISMVDMQGNTQNLSLLGKLSLEEGNRLARYLSTCVLAGTANTPKAEYLETLGETNPDERAKIGPDSVINRFIFNPPQGVAIKYIFAVNRAVIAEDTRIFQQKAQRMKLLSILVPSQAAKNASLVLPGSGEPPATPISSVQIEEVRSPKRSAKSPERAATKRKRGATDEGSASSSEHDHDTRASKKGKKDKNSSPSVKALQKVPEDDMEIEKSADASAEQGDNEENGEIALS